MLPITPPDTKDLVQGSVPAAAKETQARHTNTATGALRRHVCIRLSITVLPRETPSADPDECPFYHQLAKITRSRHP
jgi:hypothetical protein